MKFDDLTGPVAIWGAGREGRAACEELASRGIQATLVVTGAGELPKDVPVVSGDEAMKVLCEAAFVIKSPGIAHTSEEFQKLSRTGARITSLMDLWLGDYAPRVVGVTGTKGKSTTSALIHHVLRGAGLDVVFAGNVGIPVSSELGAHRDAYVVEVSSYQAAELSVSPRVVVVTSLYPEHLPWHGSYEQYVADKLNLLGHGPEVVIVPDEGIGETVRERVGSGVEIVVAENCGITVDGDELRWGERDRRASVKPQVRGSHNLRNAVMAVLAAEIFTSGGVEREELLRLLETFTPLAHRLETVPSHDGRIWVDDSLATAPEAAVAALATFRGSEITLLLGGDDRKLSFEPLIQYVENLTEKDKPRIVAMGPAGARFAAEASGRVGLVTVAEDFAEAIALAREQTNPRAIVLLSPAAPSFDEFSNYEERAAAFRAAAQAVNT